MKSLNIDIIFPWEFGLIIVTSGLILIIIGLKQDKKKPFDDLDNIPFTKPTTKILFGGFFCVFGFIQLLPLLQWNNGKKNFMLIIL